MKTYTLTYKTWLGNWKAIRFEGTCNTDARFTARMLFREAEKNMCCGYTLYDFYGNYIEL